MKNKVIILLLMSFVCLKGYCVSENTFETHQQKIHCCTVGSYKEKEQSYYLSRIYESAEKNNVSIINIGEGKKWGGNVLKPKYFFEYIQNLPDQDIVICTDACDIVYCSNLEEILSKFYRMNARIVFSTEKNCYPLTHLRHRFAHFNGPYKYLNAGGFIGYVKEIKEMLHNIVQQIKPGMRSDQALYQQYYVNNPEKIYLDTNCEIFHCLCDVDLSEVRIENERVFVKKTQTWPSILHGNGKKGKAVLISIYNQLTKN